MTLYMTTDVFSFILAYRYEVNTNYSEIKIVITLITAVSFFTTHN